MTTAADDSTDGEAFEAFLAGRPVPAQGAGLAAFAEAVRSTATLPGRPNAALADLLVTGLLTDLPSPSARTATSAGRPRASRVRIRRRIAMFFPALLAKIVGAGTVAKAATGAGVVLVAFTGAGVAGALPDPLQHGFATVAGTVGIPAPDPVPAGEDATPSGEDATPSGGETSPDGTEAPTGADGTTPGTDQDGAVTDPTRDPATDDSAPTQEEWAARGPADGQAFGDWVSEGARQGWADGATISRWAHEKHVQWPAEATTPTAGPTGAPTRTSGAETPEAGVDSDAGRTSGGHGDHGRGNGASTEHASPGRGGHSGSHD